MLHQGTKDQSSQEPLAQTSCPNRHLLCSMSKFVFSIYDAIKPPKKLRAISYANDLQVLHLWPNLWHPMPRKHCKHTLEQLYIQTLHTAGQETAATRKDQDVMEHDLLEVVGAGVGVIYTYVFIKALDHIYLNHL